MEGQPLLRHSKLSHPVELVHNPCMPAFPNAQDSIAFPGIMRSSPAHPTQGCTTVVQHHELVLTHGSIPASLLVSSHELWLQEEEGGQWLDKPVLARASRAAPAARLLLPGVGF